MGAPHEQPSMARAACARHKQLLACRRSGSAEVQARDACAFGLYGMCFVPGAHASLEGALVHFCGDGGPAASWHAGSLANPGWSPGSG